MKITLTDISTIKPYDKNPRKNDKTIELVARSISAYGFNQPIVVDKDNIIVVGHSRYAAALLLELTTVPVTVCENLTEEQTRAYRIMDNKAHDYTKWDASALKVEIEDILNVDELGFSLKEIDELFCPELIDVGKTPSKPHIVKHRVIIECATFDEMMEVKRELNDRGNKCQVNYY
jgi:site-specific DNA-methyltransferase (adenine-specific)